MVTATTIKKGYKQTELGIIPEDWMVSSLGKLCNYQNGTALEKYFNNRNGLIVISIGNYSETGKFVETSSYIDREYFKELKKFVLNKDDLTMILNDKTAVGTIIGRVLHIEENEKYIFNQRTMRLTVKDEIEPLFLYFQINGSRTHKYIVNLSKPGTQIYVNTNDIAELPVVFPKSKTEQTAIATALSDADTLISKLEELISKKINIKQGAMQELLIGRKRLPGFSGKWEMKKLGEIADFLKGRGLSKNKIVKDGNYSCILYGELFTTYSQVIKEVKSKTNSREGLPSVKGDILMPGSTTTIGIDLATASVLYQAGVLLGGDLIVIRKREPNDYNSEFLANYLTHISKYKIAEITQGITIIHLHGSRLQGIFVKIPSDVKEQTAIAQILSDMDSEIEQLEQKLDKYKMIKQGMMQELLTGRTRLI